MGEGGTGRVRGEKRLKFDAPFPFTVPNCSWPQVRPACAEVTVSHMSMELRQRQTGGRTAGQWDSSTVGHTTAVSGLATVDTEHLTLQHVFNSIYTRQASGQAGRWRRGGRRECVGRQGVGSAKEA